MFLSAIVEKIEEIQGFRRITAKPLNLDINSVLQGSYIKLVLSNSDGEEKMRSITISRVLNNSFCLDFVDHKAKGIMSEWQRRLKIGSKFQFKKPGPVSRLDQSAEEFYFCADPSALPALSAHLQTLSPSQKVYICFDGPIDVLTAYLSNSFYEEVSSIEELLSLIEACEKEKSAVWIAGERSKVFEMKKALVDKKKSFRSCYISSYWQKETTDEEHRLLKKQDPK